MKKVVLAPLCSALVIPGLGRVINQHIKKGLILLAVDFVFIIAFTIEMYQILRGVIGPGVLNSDEPGMIMERIMAGDHTPLVFLSAAFFLKAWVLLCYFLSAALSPLAEDCCLKASS